MVSLVLALLSAFSACSGGGDNEPASTATNSGVESESDGQVEPAPVPPNEIRVRIPRILVDAPISVKEVGRDGRLPDPDGLHDAVAYNLAAFGWNSGDPNSGNVVILGRLDSGRVPCFQGYVPPACFAVFGSIGLLSKGDEVKLHWLGSVKTYFVNSFCWVKPAAFDSFIQDTPHQALTLITQAGNFVRRGEGGSYSHFLMVRAVPQGETATMDCNEELAAPPPKTNPPPGDEPRETFDVRINSLSSPVRPDGEVTVRAATSPGARCTVGLAWKGVRVLGFNLDALDSAVAFVWRIPGHFPKGTYKVSVGCGKEPQLADLVVE